MGINDWSFVSWNRCISFYFVPDHLNSRHEDSRISKKASILTTLAKCAIFFLIMDLRKFASSFALTALILASFVGVCKQMIASCGIDCSQQAMSAMRMDSKMDNCTQGSATCSTASMSDHMTTFASMYPSVATNVVSLFFIITAVLVCAWFLISRGDILDNEKLKAQLRNLRLRVSQSVAPNFLVFAFSQGILNSKIYA